MASENPVQYNGRINASLDEEQTVDIDAWTAHTNIESNFTVI